MVLFFPLADIAGDESVQNQLLMPQLVVLDVLPMQLTVTAPGERAHSQQSGAGFFNPLRSELIDRFRGNPLQGADQRKLMPQQVVEQSLQFQDSVLPIFKPLADDHFGIFAFELFELIVEHPAIVQAEFLGKTALALGQARQALDQNLGSGRHGVFLPKGWFLS